MGKKKDRAKFKKVAMEFYVNYGTSEYVEVLNELQKEHKSKLLKALNKDKEEEKKHK